jgi:dTDP-4-dehydrorhamnose reductase
MRLLVTGSQGQVARALAERAGGDCQVVCLGRPELDLASGQDPLPLIRAADPDIIVSAAAYTAVDKAESEPDLAFAVNQRGAGAVAKAAAAMDLPLIHLSTDYVFGGQGNRPLREDEPTAPLGVYGASKLAGELAVAEATRDHAILRTAWVYAPYGVNFLRTMLRLATTRDEVRVVADQFGTPNSALDLADAILWAARRMLERPADSALRGLFHLTAEGGPVSWADFAEEIFRLSAAAGGPKAKVTRITTADYPTPARRPCWSLLDGGRFRQNFKWRAPDWREGLRKVIGRLAEMGEWA